MVAECRGDHTSQWAAVESIAAKIGCTPQTLLTWVRQHEARYRPARRADHCGSEARQELEREVRELRKANEILKLASAFSPRRSSTADSSPEVFRRRAS